MGKFCTLLRSFSVSLLAQSGVVTFRDSSAANPFSSTVSENLSNLPNAQACDGTLIGVTGITTIGCTAGTPANGATIDVSVATGINGTVVTFDLVGLLGGNGEVTWDCNNPSDARYVPAECRA